MIFLDIAYEPRHDYERQALVLESRDSKEQRCMMLSGVNAAEKNVCSLQSECARQKHDTTLLVTTLSGTINMAIVGCSYSLLQPQVSCHCPAWV